MAARARGRVLLAPKTSAMEANFRLAIAICETMAITICTSLHELDTGADFVPHDVGE